MTKGIIELEIPAMCCDCPIEADYYYCHLADIDTAECRDIGKPIDCPIKPCGTDNVIAYIDRIANSGLGKKKSLEYIKKFVKEGV